MKIIKTTSSLVLMGFMLSLGTTTAISEDTKPPQEAKKTLNKKQLKKKLADAKTLDQKLAIIKLAIAGAGDDVTALSAIAQIAASDPSIPSQSLDTVFAVALADASPEVIKAVGQVLTDVRSEVPNESDAVTGSGEVVQEDEVEKEEEGTSDDSSADMDPAGIIVPDMEDLTDQLSEDDKPDRSGDNS